MHRRLFSNVVVSGWSEERFIERRNNGRHELLLDWTDKTMKDEFSTQQVMPAMCYSIFSVSHQQMLPARLRGMPQVIRCRDWEEPGSRDGAGGPRVGQADTAKAQLPSATCACNM